MKTTYKIIIGIISIFIIINLGWYGLVQYRYSDFIKDIPKNEDGLNYIQDNEGYHISVKTPNYLRLTGNLAVSDKKDRLSLIIWPNIFKKDQYEYGVTILDGAELNMIEVDKNLQPLSKYGDDIKELVYKNKEELNKLLQKAKGLYEN